MTLAGPPGDALVVFWLVLGRSSGVVASAPLLATSSVPPQVRALLTLIVTLAAVPAAHLPSAQAPAAVLPLVAAVGLQVLIGLLIGVVAQAIFSAAQMAGAVLDVQLGFSLAQVVDPIYGQPISLLGGWFNLLASLAYLVAGGLEVLVGAVALSLRGLPLGLNLQGAASMGAVLGALGWAFGAALALAVPVMAVSLILTVVLGLVGRMVPQFNVLQSVLPAQTLVAVGLLLFLTPVLLAGFAQLVPQTLSRLGALAP